jgi:hypothetical protein
MRDQAGHPDLRAPAGLMEPVSGVAEPVGHRGLEVQEHQEPRVQVEQDSLGLMVRLGLQVLLGLDLPEHQEHPPLDLPLAHRERAVPELRDLMERVALRELAPTELRGVAVLLVLLAWDRRALPVLRPLGLHQGPLGQVAPELPVATERQGQAVRMDLMGHPEHQGEVLRGRPGHHPMVHLERQVVQGHLRGRTGLLRHCEYREIIWMGP